MYANRSTAAATIGRLNSMLFTKTTSVAKLFFLLSLSGLFTYVILAFYSFHTTYVSMARLKNIHKNNKIYVDPELETIESNLGNDIKYILVYSMNVTHKHYQSPFIEGQYYFNNQQCTQRNCYLTVKKHLLNKDMRNFDAVIMNANELPYMRLPELRSTKQKYIFYGMDTPNHKLACRIEVDRYFNWTWTYRLYSDISSPFYEVRNLEGKVVAPRPNVHWTDKIATTYLKDEEVSVYQKKTKAVAAFVKNCRVKDGKIYPDKLRTALQLYSLTLDIYGCDKQCPSEEGCNKLIENDYYFVLVQEKIFADDYLTDEVLKAYLNNAVPLIRSGAQLKKFLPTASYINVRRNGVERVAALIHYSIKNPAVYYSYFRWKRYYTFHKSVEYSGVCQLCDLLNNKKSMDHHRSHSRLRKWWYSGPIDEKFCSNMTSINTTEVFH